jgi:peptidoglycan/LPS O-acetylase OafA/YrhL
MGIAALSKNPPPPEKIWLTIIRVPLSLWVLLYHLDGFAVYERKLFQYYDTGWLIPRGYLAVDLFFSLSGFIIAYRYAEEIKAGFCSHFKKFIEKRFWRLYPAHLVMVCLMGVPLVLAVLMGKEVGQPSFYHPFGLFLNASLLQSFALQDFPSWNGIAWAVGAEMVGYAVVFPLCLWLIGHAPRLVNVGLTILISAIIFYLCHTWMGNLNVSHDGGVLRIFPTFMGGFFLYQCLPLRLPAHQARLLSLLGLIAVVVICYLPVAHEWLIYPASMVLIAGLYYLPPPNSYAFWRVLRFGGILSYTFYVGHLFIITMTGRAMRQLGMADDGVTLLAAVIFMIIASYIWAYILWRYVEERYK